MLQSIKERLAVSHFHSQGIHFADDFIMSFDSDGTARPERVIYPSKGLSAYEAARNIGRAAIGRIAESGFTTEIMMDAQAAEQTRSDGGVLLRLVEVAVA